MAAEKSEIKVKSLHKALRVLDCFAEKQPLGITEISEKLGLYKSNVFDIVSTLTAMNYLFKSEESGKYYLGRKFVTLGRGAEEHFSFHNVAAPHLSQLSNEVGEITYLTVPIGYQLYYMDSAKPAGNSPYISAVLRNSYDSLNCTGSGKAMLAHMPDEFVEEYLSTPLSRQTEKTITDPDELRKELELIRKRGYSVDDEEYAIGLRCVAMAIVDHNGEVLGAMSASGPSSRFTETRQQQIAEKLKAHVCEIQNNL